MSDELTGTDRRPEARVPSTFIEYVRALGPGILVAMAWLSAGDLVSASVSGSTYGYALMWALVVETWMAAVVIATVRLSGG